MMNLMTPSGKMMMIKSQQLIVIFRSDYALYHNRKARVFDTSPFLFLPPAPPKARSH